MVRSATLAEFARMKDLAAATRSKLRKQRLIAEFLRGLDEADLRRAVQFSAGRALAWSDTRTLNVGWALVSDVAVQLLKLDRQRYYDAVVRHGEIGEALAELWPTASGDKPGLTLAEVGGAFEELAAASTVERRRELLRELLGRAGGARQVAYLAKIIFGDMRTGVQEGLLQGAIAEAFDRPIDAVRRAQLLLGDLEQVALLARENSLDTAQFRLFHPVQFMLATPQEDAKQAAATMSGGAWFAEDKLDGIRAQIHKSANRVIIYTRTMDRADDSFPEVVEAIRGLDGEFLLDGEIVPCCEGKVLPFAHIQKRLGRKRVSGRILSENPAGFVAFDLLYSNGRLLIDEPLEVRRRELAQLAGERLMLTPMQRVRSADEIGRSFDEARGRRNEGIVLKDPASAYAPGRRGRAWLKLKTHLPTLDCVVTAAEYGRGKRKGTLSDYTFAVWDRPAGAPEAKLVNIGKAFSGVTDQEIAQLTELFEKLSLSRHGHVHVVQPQVVLEVAFDQIQRSSRHPGGFALRFPRIKHIRWDKLAKEADRLERVREIYFSEANFAHNPEARREAAEPTLFHGI